MSEVTTWHARPLQPTYPVVFFDAMRVKIHENAVVRNKAIYLVLGWRLNGLHMNGLESVDATSYPAIALVENDESTSLHQLAKSALLK